MRGGSTEPARIVGGELFRSVTVKIVIDTGMVMDTLYLVSSLIHII